MERRALGKNGPLVPALGLGCMGMSDFYGPRDEAESLATLNHALDRGVTHLDTADMYGFGENEELLGKLLQTRRREVFLRRSSASSATAPIPANARSAAGPNT